MGLMFVTVNVVEAVVPTGTDPKSVRGGSNLESGEPASGEVRLSVMAGRVGHECPGVVHGVGGCEGDRDGAAGPGGDGLAGATIGGHGEPAAGRNGVGERSDGPVGEVGHLEHRGGCHAGEGVSERPRCEVRW